MKSKLFIVALLIATILGSCVNPKIHGIGVGRSNRELCDEVYLIKGDTVSWVQTADPNCFVEKSGKFFHYHEGDSVRTEFIWCEDSWIAGTIIEGHIVDHARDDDFILANQQPIDSILGKYITDSHGVYRREHDTVHQYYDRLLMLKTSHAIHQYWILKIKTADVYGPFSYLDYLDMKKQLGVPSTLRLMGEKEAADNN